MSTSESYSIILGSDARMRNVQGQSLSNATFKFDMPLELTHGQVIIPSIMVPRLNNINSLKGNDKFQVDLANSGTFTTLSIPQGEYTSASSIAGAIKNAMGAEAASKSVSDTYNVSIDICSSTVVMSSVNSLNFSFKVIAGDLLNFMGFDAGTYTGSAIYTAASSPNVYPDIVLINSDISKYLTRGKNVVGTVSGTAQPSEMVMSMFIKEAGQKVFDNSLPQRLLLSQDVTLRTMRFWLTEADGLTPVSVSNQFVMRLDIYSSDQAAGR